MKICYLCADPGVPVFGRKGCSTHVRETCLALVELGHDVRLICSNAGEDQSRRHLLKIHEVKPFTSKKLGFDLRRVLTSNRLARTARRVIADFQPDAIYERYSIYSEAGTKLAVKLGLPGILEINAFMSREQRDRLRLPALAAAVERRIFRRAKHLVAVSEPLVGELAELRGNAENITHMPMAVNLEFFRPEPPNEELVDRLGVRGRFVIGYVGTLTSWHGIDLLYILAAQLKQMGMKDFKIVIVGGDERRIDSHREKVREAGLTDCVILTGAAPYEEVPAYMNVMDVALVPDTTYWSSPAKMFEYQGCGVPVVAPHIRAVELAMSNGVEGFIFEPKQVDQMAQRVWELYNNPQMREEMGARARIRAERFHSWQAQGRHIVEILARQAKQ